MANEHTLIFETHVPLPFTCSGAVTIEKGAFCKMTDPMTALLADGDEDIVAGVCAEEKIANDGRTKVPIYRGGVFKATASGGITVGDALITAASSGGTNQLATAAVNSEDIVGVSLETATAGETFLYELMPRTNNLA